MASPRSTKARSPLEQEIRDSFQTRKRVFIGLIPLPADELAKVRENVLSKKKLALDELKKK